MSTALFSVIFAITFACSGVVVVVVVVVVVMDVKNDDKKSKGGEEKVTLFDVVAFGGGVDM